jgi:hypothetical protein
LKREFAPVDRYEIYAYLGRSYALGPPAMLSILGTLHRGVGEAGGDPALEARYGLF